MNVALIVFAIVIFLLVLAREYRKLKQDVGDGPRRVDLSDEADSLLTAAHKAARELRESARADSEQALKKARRRAAEIEQEAERSATNAQAVLDAAAALRATLREALRRLEDAEPPSGAAPAEPSPAETAHSSGPSEDAVSLGALGGPQGLTRR